MLQMPDVACRHERALAGLQASTWARAASERCACAVNAVILCLQASTWARAASERCACATRLHLVFAGVNVGACGERTLRLRNTLIFESKHAEIFLDRLEQVLAETK